MATVKRETIHGTEVWFEVDSHGRFTADLGDHGEFSGATLAEVVAAVTKTLKTQKQQKSIEVTFVCVEKKKSSWAGGREEYMTGDQAIDLTLRGYAARTRDWLITDNGAKGKISKGYGDGGPVPCRRLTPAEHATWTQLQKNVDAAEAAIEDFISARQLNVKKLMGGDD